MAATSHIGDTKENVRSVRGASSIGFAAVYVIGHAAKTCPLKIGWASNVLDRVSQIQVSHWEAVTHHLVFWTMGPPLARRLEAKAHEVLDRASKRIRGEWFSIDIEWAEKVILFAANDLGIEVFDEVEKNRRATVMLAAKEERQWDPFR